MSLKHLVATVAEALVDEPDAVEVDEIDEDRGVVVELRVAPDDIGKVIGKEGRTAQSIRSLLNAAAAKQGCRASLEILD
ncbi:MAG: KH domain-containing protein [Polyangiaceae bacterium]|nr:KH domain-containing protein [Polyangiaceae bacterium]